MDGTPSFEDFWATVPYFSRAFLFISITTHFLSWIVDTFMLRYFANFAKLFIDNYYFWTALTSTFTSYYVMDLLMACLFIFQTRLVEASIGTISFLISFTFRSILTNILYVLLVLLLGMSNQDVYKTFFVGVFPMYMSYFTSDTVKHPWTQTQFCFFPFTVPAVICLLIILIIITMLAGVQSLAIWAGVLIGLLDGFN